MLCWWRERKGFSPCWRIGPHVERSPEKGEAVAKVGDRGERAFSTILPLISAYLPCRNYAQFSATLHTPALVGRKEQRKKKRKENLGKVKMSASEGDRREKLHFAASSSSAVAPANYEVSFKLTALLLSGPVFCHLMREKGEVRDMLGVGVALLQWALSHSAAFWEQSGIKLSLVRLGLSGATHPSLI